MGVLERRESSADMLRFSHNKPSTMILSAEASAVISNLGIKLGLFEVWRYGKFGVSIV